MPGRKPIPQVKAKVKNPAKALAEFKKKGGAGYVVGAKRIKDNKGKWSYPNTNYLWLRGTEEMIKRMLPDARIIKSVGQ